MENSNITDSTHLSQFRLMARYNTWANHNIYDLVGELTETERQQNLGLFFKSIEGTLNHLLLGDRAWLGRFATGTGRIFTALQDAKLIFQFDSLAQTLYADFTELRRERQATDRAIEAWMAELTPEILAANLHYTNFTRGIDRQHSLWFGLTHFFNHQTHHRSQVTTALHQLGRDYGTTDFLAMYDLAREFV